MWEGRREGWTWGFFILGVSLRAGAMPGSLSRAGQRGTPARHLLTPQQLAPALLASHGHETQIHSSATG